MAHVVSAAKSVLKFKFRCGYYRATVYQLAVSLIALWLTRFLFYAYNVSDLSGIEFDQWPLMLWGGLRFDLCAVVYFNALFVLMRFLPFGFVRARWWIVSSNVVYAITNALMLALNIAEVPLFGFVGSRMRWESLLAAFGDSNMVNILISYFGDYWWAFVGGGLYIAFVIWLAFRPEIISPKPIFKNRLKLWAYRIAMLLIAALFSVCAICSSLLNGRLMSIGDVAWYVKSPVGVDVVLNTPFTVVRSIGKQCQIQPMRFFSDEALAAVRRPFTVFTETDTIAGVKKQKDKNVVIIVLESGAQLWLDALNIVNDDEPRGLMPFLDSIATRSLVCRHVMATGVASIGGITSIFGGFPAFEPFRYPVSLYNTNILDAPVNLLKSLGYSSKAYFGGKPGSFNIDQMLRISGFDEVVTFAEYGNRRDYDGKWGIFDHAMGGYAASDLASLPQPFVAGWFTISTHAPFVVPTDWQADGYKSATKTVQQTVEYTDRSLRHFFDIAKRQNWFENTLFVITADHGCRDLKGTKYASPYIKNHIPFIVYAPDGSIKPGEVKNGVMSQIDIAPSLMHIVGYDKPFISVGTDIFDAARPHYGLSKIGGHRFMITGLKYVVMADSDLDWVLAVYDAVSDQELRQKLVDYDSDEVDGMLMWARALMQDYTCRMVYNRLSVKTQSGF